MPRSVAHFLRHALRRRVDEFDLRVKPEWFDYESPALSDGQEAWRQALFSAAHFPSSLWRQTLQQAVRLVASHLLNPEETLARFVFGPRSDALEVGLVKDRLGYFLAYPALGDVLHGYFDKKGLVDIKRSDFSRILVRADRTLTADYSVERWLNVMEPLFEMGPLADPDGHTPRLPVSIVRGFFEAKGRHDIASALVAKQGSLASTKVSAPELSQVLKDIDGSEAPTTSAHDTETSPSPTDERTPRRHELHQQPDGGVPRWVQFRKPNGDNERGDVDNNGTGADDGDVLEAGSENLPLGRRAPHPDDAGDDDRGQGQTSEDSEIPRWRILQGERADDYSPPGIEEAKAIEKAVVGEEGVSMRDRFVETLFAGNYAAYRGTLEKLHQVESWDEASQIIADDVFRKFAVNIYDEPAISFTNAVESRFLSRE